MPQSNANEHLANHLMFYLRAIFKGGRSTFSIAHYGILDWSQVKICARRKWLLVKNCDAG
jgi:hypothetical protein